MPLIDVTIVRDSVPAEALTAMCDQLVTALLRAECAPDTTFLRENTLVYVHQLEPDAILVGGRGTGAPRFRVELTVYQGALSAERKEQLVADVHAAVTAAAGIDPAGARALHVWTFINEVPEGNWAAAGRIVYRSQVSGLTTAEGFDGA